MPLAETKLTDAEKYRRHCRGVFKSAYGSFKELSLAYHVSAHLMPIDGMGGGPKRLLRISDWISDFELAGMRVLNGKNGMIFILHLCNGLSERGTMRALGLISKRDFEDRQGLIAERVGSELLRRKLWPVRGYFAGVDG